MLLGCSAEDDAKNKERGDAAADFIEQKVDRAEAAADQINATTQRTIDTANSIDQNGGDGDSEDDDAP